MLFDAAHETRVVEQRELAHSDPLERVQLPVRHGHAVQTIACAPNWPLSGQSSDFSFKINFCQTD